MIGTNVLLEHLQHHEVVGALDTQAGVLADQLTRYMLGDHLVTVSWRRREDVQHDVLDRVRPQTQLLGTAPSLDDIDANEWHGCALQW